MTVIEPAKGWHALGLRDILFHRELLWFFVWRDVKVRYQQTILGVLWVVLQPLSYALIFTLIFGRVIGVPAGNIPYPLFCFTGLVLWSLFSAGVTAASPSVISHTDLVQKVYFPRLLLPMSAVLVGMVDFTVNLIVLAVLLVYYQVVPSSNLVFAPLFVLGALAAALGFGSLLAALNVPFRDVRHLTPFITQIWLIATPIAYPMTLLPEQWRGLAALNPMSGLAEGFRWAVLGTPAPTALVLGGSLLAVMLMLLIGAIVFKRLETRFADVI